MDWLKDKVCMVTGGARGIGKDIVKTLFGYGAKVYFCDKDHHAGKDLAAQCPGTRFAMVDVSDAASLGHWLEDAVSDTDRADIIVNNAGISEFSPLASTSVEDFDRIIATNLRPVFITSRWLARHRQELGIVSRYGRIINIASTRWIQSEPGTEAYSASKGGIVSLTHALMMSFASTGVTVNCISPGWIDTGHYQKISRADHMQHPSARVGRVSDISSAVIFLADPANDFINGQNIVIDGGMTRKMIYVE